MAEYKEGQKVYVRVDKKAYVGVVKEPAIVGTKSMFTVVLVQSLTPGERNQELVGQFQFAQKNNIEPLCTDLFGTGDHVASALCNNNTAFIVTGFELASNRVVVKSKYKDSNSRERYAYKVSELNNLTRQTAKLVVGKRYKIQLNGLSHTVLCLLTMFTGNTDNGEEADLVFYALEGPSAGTVFFKLPGSTGSYLPYDKQMKYGIEYMQMEEDK